MRSVNRITLLGHIATEPKEHETSQAVPFTTFRLATNRRWRDENGELREFVDFHSVVAWHKLAEICAQYLHKGAAVYIEGRLTNNVFTDKEGQEQRKSEIILEQLSMLDKKGSSKQEKELEEKQVTPS